MQMVYSNYTIFAARNQSDQSCWFAPCDANALQQAGASKNEKILSQPENVLKIEKKQAAFFLSRPDVRVAASPQNHFNFNINSQWGLFIKMATD